MTKPNLSNAVSAAISPLSTRLSDLGMTSAHVRADSIKGQEGICICLVASTTLWREICDSKSTDKRYHPSTIAAYSLLTCVTAEARLRFGVRFICSEPLELGIQRVTHALEYIQQPTGRNQILDRLTQQVVYLPNATGGSAPNTSRAAFEAFANPNSPWLMATVLPPAHIRSQMLISDLFIAAGNMLGWSILNQQNSGVHLDTAMRMVIRYAKSITS